MNLAAALLLLTYSVTDGDTLRAGDVRVRLWGIDAPEMNEKGGLAAKDQLNRITKGQKLTCQIKDTDRYGRIVALCETPDGTDIACAMVSLGHASDWPKYSGGYYDGC